MKYFHKLKFILRIFYTRIFRSIVFRSGILLDISNNFKKELFNRDLSIESMNKIHQIRKLILNSFYQTDLIFLGDKYRDGTYPVLEKRNYKDKFLLSFGVGNNIILEIEAVKLGMTAFSYDHTTIPKIPPRLKSKIFYFPIGITGKNQIPQTKKIDELISSSNLNFSQIEILKLDIEGCEWDVIDSDIEFIKEIPQLIIEFHDLDKITNPIIADYYLKVFSNLLKYYAPFYLSPNNYSGWQYVDSSLWPFTLEMGLISKKLINRSLETQLFNRVKFNKDQSFNWPFGPRLTLESWWE